MTNHPTQGLQDMTLDLSTYSDSGLKELQARIEEEKTKRERKVLFNVECTSVGDVISSVDVYALDLQNSIMKNLYHRLTAEAKLRAAGGGELKQGEHGYFMKLVEVGMEVYSTYHPSQGTLYFKTPDQALSAYGTLTPDEKAAIFGFGEG